MDDSAREKRIWWAAVAAITLTGFGLRLFGAGESPAGDELTMYTLVHGRSFGSMMDIVVNTEKTPPLGFALAWVTSRIGSADTWMRAPEVIAGTAAITVTALLGRRAVSRSAGLVAAALAAASPFLLFYAIEARSYSLALCFTCASLVLLLRGTEEIDPDLAMWIGWGASVLAALMSHYTAGFVIAVSVAWALIARPAARKQVLLACAAVGLLLLPWLPSFATQLSHAGDEARRVSALAPLKLDSVWQVTSRSLIGDPVWSGLKSINLNDVPGEVGLVMIATGLGIGVVGACARAWRLRAGGWRRLRPSAPVALILLTAVAAPIGLILGSLKPHHSMLLPRNAITSVPSAAVLAALLLTRLARPAALIATALAVGGLAIGSVTELHDYARPNFRGAAHAVEGRWHKGDALLEAIYFNGPPTDLTIHLGPQQRAALQLARDVGLQPFLDSLSTGQTVFTVTPLSDKLPVPLGPPPAIRRAFRPVWSKTWRGMLDVNVTEWQPTRVRAR